MLLFGATAARAAEPVTVFYTDGPAAAVDAVERATARPPWEIVPMPLVAPDAPAGVVSFGGGAPPACPEPSTAGAVRARLADAEVSVAAGAWEAAREPLRSTLGLAECLREPAEASVLARAALLLGVSEDVAGDHVAATAAFARALSFQPTVAWDVAFPASARAAFDAARAQPQGRLVVGPGAEVTTLWVDGRPLPVDAGGVSVVAGRHLVQFVDASVSTVVTDVGNGAIVALLSPERLAKAYAGASNPAFGPYLPVYLAARAPGVAYVWTGAALLDPAAGGVALPLHAPDVPHRSVLGSGLRVAGAGLLGVGVTSAVIGEVTYQRNAEGEVGETEEEYRRRIVAAGAGSGMALAGFSACGVGAAALVISLPLGGGR